jgi:hypothetical protein
LSSKNRHDTRSTLVLNIVTQFVVYVVVYVFVYVVFYVVVYVFVYVFVYVVVPGTCCYCAGRSCALNKSHNSKN